MRRPPGEALIRRRLDDEHSVILVQGGFASLIAAYRDHVTRWELGSDGLLDTMMRQGLSGVVLHMALRPLDESVGVTINFRQPVLNIFITGDAATRWITGRAFTEGVRATDSSRLYLQSQRPRRDPSTSIVDVAGLDILQILEQYYRHSEQAPARFFELDGDRRLVTARHPRHSIGPGPAH